MPRPAGTRFSRLSELYGVEARRFILWLPVCLGLGIWIYFALPDEPDPAWAAFVALPSLVVFSGAAHRAGWGALLAASALFGLTGGFALAVLSAHLVHGPTITHPIGETVEGRIVNLSRSASGAPRLLLENVTIYGLEAGETPHRIRLTLIDDAPDPLPIPGQSVRVYASLLPTGEPVEPGAFDFRRRAYFDGLGGIALARGRLIVLPTFEENLDPWTQARIWLRQTRDRLSRHLRGTLPGREGAFAAAIIVGDRVDIGDADAEALRASNLAHLLAISGLHMGILTGLVFALARALLTLPASIALRWPTKKIAAMTALCAGLGYLMLSGATVATQRAFVMVSVAFIAVLLDRPAITLRGLALAASVILVIRPVSLMDAGFQMSFAATAALVAGFEAARGRDLDHFLPGRHGPSRIARIAVIYIGALAFTSILAGGATAPIAAFHFNRTAPYGLPANLLAVPIMGLWIAPCSCLAAVLAPLGLSDIALRAMGWGIEHVLTVAHWIANLPGAVQPVRAAPEHVLGLLALGGLWLVLWRGRWRYFGIAIIGGALVLWQGAPPRPDLLVAPGGKLIGLLGPDGRVVDHHRVQGFAAKTWLRRDGDRAPQAEAAARPGLTRKKGGLSGDLPDGWRVEARWSQKVSAHDLTMLCKPKTVLVARRGQEITGPCLYFGEKILRRRGAVALRITEGTPIVRYARDPAHLRPWSSGGR